MKVFASALSLAVCVVLMSVGSSAEYGGKVAVRELARATLAADGQPIRYPTTDRPEVTALVITIPENGETGWHHHPIPVYAYIIEGTLEVEMKSGEIRVYRAGEALIEAVNTPHNGRVQGGQPVKLVAFYTGELGTPTTVMHD